MTDTTTFTDEARRAEVDAWLYETCTQCLQHMVDIVVQFYPVVQPLLTRILDLLSNFIRWAAGCASPACGSTAAAKFGQCDAARILMELKSGLMVRVFHTGASQDRLLVSWIMNVAMLLCNAALLEAHLPALPLSDE